MLLVYKQRFCEGNHRTEIRTTRFKHFGRLGKLLLLRTWAVPMNGLSLTKAPSKHDKSVFRSAHARTHERISRLPQTSARVELYGPIKPKCLLIARTRKGIGETSFSRETCVRVCIFEAAKAHLASASRSLRRSARLLSRQTSRLSFFWARKFRRSTFMRPTRTRSV